MLMTVACNHGRLWLDIACLCRQLLEFISFSSTIGRNAAPHSRTSLFAGKTRKGASTRCIPQRSTCNIGTEDVGPALAGLRSYSMQHANARCSCMQRMYSAHPASFWAHKLAHSSVRSIFAGHTNSKAGYSYRIWSLFRVLCFVAIAMSPLSAIRTVVFVILLVCSCGISLYRIPRRCAATPHRRHHARCWRRCSSKA